MTDLKKLLDALQTASQQHATFYTTHGPRADVTKSWAVREIESRVAIEAYVATLDGWKDGTAFVETDRVSALKNEYVALILRNNQRMDSLTKRAEEAETRLSSLHLALAQCRATLENFVEYGYEREKSVEILNTLFDIPPRSL